MESIPSYVSRKKEEMEHLLYDLCRIPAPSHHEELRAEFCKKYLEQAGAENVTIDRAKNVLYPLNCEGSKEITVIMAHTDTVFPDTEPMPVHIENGRLYSPGAGDDTASLTCLLLAASYAAENHLRPEKGILFAANSCEEGLGNLLGIRTIVQDYAGRIAEVISFDSHFETIVNRAVGSVRYRIEAQTRGGHSFSDFGRRNAIEVLSSLICDLYRQKLPTLGKTTFNVGTITGGTSVNTIAQKAEMLYEYRSDEQESLEQMEDSLQSLLKQHQSPDTKILVKKIGERPCMGKVDPDKLNSLLNRCSSILQETVRQTPQTVSGSTDANIPLSLGVPALSMGVYEGAGAHTREEYVVLSSLPVGLETAIKLVLSYCEM